MERRAHSQPSGRGRASPAPREPESDAATRAASAQEQISSEAERDETGAEGLCHREWSPQRIETCPVGEPLLRGHLLSERHLSGVEGGRRKAAADIGFLQIVIDGSKADQESQQADAKEASEPECKQGQDQAADRRKGAIRSSGC